MPESAAKKRWMKENTVFVGVKFVKTTESEMINYLQGKTHATELKKALRYMIAHEDEVNEYERKRKNKED